MEVITTILLCTVGFLVYLVNANNNEILRLKNILRETEYLIREKDEENSSLKKQLASEKNKLLRQPAVNVNEVSRLKKEIDKNRSEISDLQKKLRGNENIISDLQKRLNEKENIIPELCKRLREKDNIISDLRNLKGNLNLNSNDEVQNLRQQLSAAQNNNHEIFSFILMEKY